MAESLRQADISHMDLLAPVASKFSSIVEMIVASFKIDIPLSTLPEMGTQSSANPMDYLHQ